MNELISREELLETIRSMTVTMGGRELFLPSLKDAVIDAISIAPAVSPTEWIEWYTDQIKQEFHYRIVKEDPVAAVVQCGRWEPKSDDDQDEGVYICSNCKAEEFFPFNEGYYRYCPNCGVKMCQNAAG